MKFKHIAYSLFIFVFLFSGIVSAQGTISGVVVDKLSQTPLPGVNIIALETDFGASTDTDGKFVIENLPVGNYRIKASFIGYESKIKTDVVVKSAVPAFIRFELIESVIEIEGVTVTSGYFETSSTEITSIKEFSYEEIRRSPGGFEDVVRALSVLPGVAQASAGRNDLVVRGGAPSENLFLVDGFTVPNINHFGSQGATGGPLSFINLDYVRNTTFSTGGFSSLYGDKLSSVLSINLQNGRSERIGGKALISASQFGFNLDGPINDNGNFIFSIRRSYLDFIFNAAGFGFVPEYYDLLGKFNYNFDKQNSIKILFVGALDDVKFNNDTEENKKDNARILGSSQRTYLFGTSYRHLMNDAFMNFSFSRNFTKYNSSQRDYYLNPIFLNNSIEAENELKAESVFKLNKSSELTLGVSGKLIEFETDLKLPTFATSFGDTLEIASLYTKQNYYKSSVYANFTNTVFDKIRYNFGIREDYFSGINNKFYFSPRFSMSYMLSNLVSINASAGIYQQFPSYIWLAAYESNKDLKAVQVNQYILGFDFLLREDTKLKVEAFLKDYKNYPASKLRTYLVLANTGAGYGGSESNFSSFGLEPLASGGKGNSRGIELSIQKKSSGTPLYGIFSLTYSETNFTSLDGIERPGSYDQSWILNLNTGYSFNEKWEASMKFRFATGYPFTPYDQFGMQSPLYFNIERMKSFHSLDLRVDRRFDFDGLNLIVYLDVQNVYNNKNSTTVRWDADKKAMVTDSSIGVLPSIGVSLEF